MLQNVREKVAEIGQEVVDNRNREANIAWIMANRQDLIENYPSRWIAVDRESVQLVHIEFDPLFKIMHERAGLNGSLVFYYSNSYMIPMILQLCDVDSPSTTY